MNDRVLQVFLGPDRVGELSEGGGVWRFTYDGEWQRRADRVALSPHLPFSPEPLVDGSTSRPLQWFFDNLLPEEGLRQRMAREVRVSEADAFGLLAAYGSESAGALTLLAQGQALAPGALAPLDERSLLARIRGLSRETLPAKAPKKMSLAGAQHKLAIVLEGGRMFEPQGAMPSTHILKPDHPDANAYPHSAVNEWFTMRLAARLGLEVPAAEHRYVPVEDSPGGHEAIYVVERFDRVRRGDKVRRIHAVDGCQVLNLDRTYKYSAMTIESLLAIAGQARSRAATRIRLFRWAVFNVLVANADAHLKNLSFLMTPQGCELAPHYDLVSTASFDVEGDPAAWRRVPMSLALPGAERFGDVTARSLIGLGESLGLRAKVAARIVEAMRSAIGPAADELIAEFEQRTFVESAAVLRGGELRVLRQIRHVVVAEMVRRLET